jgi:hypothetical protein
LTAAAPANSAASPATDVNGDGRGNRHGLALCARGLRLGTHKAAAVGVSGTPRFALGLSSVAAALLVLTGTLEQVLALSAVVFVFNYI